jgi:hypothetical protein
LKLAAEKKKSTDLENEKAAVEARLAAEQKKLA